MRRDWIKSIVWIAVITVTFASCKKKQIELPEENSPVFRVEGTLDGQEINLVAGDNNAYMYTSWKTERGVSVFSGNLSDGSTSVELEIYDGFVDMPDRNKTIPESSGLQIATESSVPYAILSKDNLPNIGLISNLDWVVDGVNMGSGDVEIVEPGIYNVCAHVTFYSGAYVNLCSELIIGYQHNANCFIKHYLNQNGILTVWAEASSKPIDKINWYADGQLLGMNTELQIPIDSSSYELSADVFFTNGVVRSKKMVVDGSLGGYFINDLSFFENSPATTSTRDFDVRVKVTQNGVTYSSDLANNDASTVDITNVTYYGTNDYGDNVFKIEGAVNAFVADEQGNVKEVSFNTHFGFAIP